MTDDERVVHQSERDPGPLAQHGPAASSSSASPTDGRPRTAARAVASRDASTIEAVDASSCWVRSSRATRTSQPVASDSSSSSRDQWSKRYWYQPGDVTPAPYPLARASRPDDHGAQVAATFALGRPLSSAVS